MTVISTDASQPAICRNCYYHSVYYAHKQHWCELRDEATEEMETCDKWKLTNQSNLQGESYE